MKILITGATGLVGQHLVGTLSQHHQLILAGRSLKKLTQTFGDQHTYINNHSLLQDTTNLLESIDCVINLAGENIGAKRWTKKQLIKISNSRVELTACIASAAAELGPDRAPRIINASAIGIYGLQPTTEMQLSTVFDESSKLPSTGTDELSRIGLAWEGALQPAIDANISVTILRFGVILAKQGGALAKLLPSFSLGMGAILGNGKQPFTWVALNDVIRAIEFIVNHPKLSGPFNIVAPNPTNQATFARVLASTLKKPCLITLPAFAVKLLFGKMGDELLLNGQLVAPIALTEAGFTFSLPTIDVALKAIINN